MPDMSLIQSMLFAPADRPDRFAHGPASRADRLIGVSMPGDITIKPDCAETASRPRP